MQKIFTLSCVLLFTALSAFKPKPINGVDEVIAALNSGNAAELAKFIDDNIEISLPDKSNTYSRAQAVMILRDFFESNGVRSFEVKHKGEQGSSQFCIGTLITRLGNYRTTVFMKASGGRQVVREIRFQSA